MKNQLIKLSGIIMLSFVSMIPREVYAQHPNILISDFNYPNEPAICLNPINPAIMLAAANNDNYYLTDDGGLTWTSAVLTSPWNVFGDPCVVCDTAGNFYFFHLSNPPGGNWIDRIVCQKLPAGGSTWTPGTYTYHAAGKQQDKEWAVVNPFNNEIYVTWTQFDSYGSSNPLDSSLILFAKSTDGGDTWSAVKRLSQTGGDCIDEDNTVEGAVPAVGPDGQIYVSWAGPAGILFDRSLDGGNTWLDQDIFVTSQPGGWDFSVPGIFRCNGFPVTCCDISPGPCQGNIYINFSDQRNGDSDTDIWLVKSTDGGDTWSNPIRVNDDPPGKQQFFTWMTVDQVTGYLYFVFYDRRNYTNSLTDVYMALSKDGGETFTNFKVSQSPFEPVSSIFFGDYTNVAAHNNVIRPVWARLHNGDLSIYTAIVDPDYVGIPESPAPPFSIDQVYPNPAGQSTFFSYKIRRPCHVSLTVMNMLGKEIVTLINQEEKQPGKYVINFDPSQYKLAPGAYFFRLRSDAALEKRQLIVVK